MKNTIDITAPEYKETVQLLSRMSARITGKVTFGKLSNFLLVLPEEKRPSQEFVKAYVKFENQ